MTLKIKKLPKNVFDYIEKFLPFSSVDIIISYKNRGIIITRRAIRPYRGWWHLPGSIVLKNEEMTQTVTRSAAEELGIRIYPPKFVGNYELFTANRHYITHLYQAEWKSGEIKLDGQSNGFMIAKPDNLPKKFIPIQRKMVNDATRLGLI